MFSMVQVSSSLKIIKSGSVSSTTTINHDTPLDPSKYIVVIYSNAYHYDRSGQYNQSVAYGYGMGAWWSDKTSNSVKINVSSGITCSYEIIQVPKVLKSGQLTATSTINLEIPLDPSKYMIFISTSGYETWYNASIYQRMESGYGVGAYWSGKTSNGVTINISVGITCSYDIVQIAN